LTTLKQPTVVVPELSGGRPFARLLGLVLAE
jgi:hypothetical protein